MLPIGRPGTYAAAAAALVAAAGAGVVTGIKHLGGLGALQWSVDETRQLELAVEKVRMLAASAEDGISAACLAASRHADPFFLVDNF